MTAATVDITAETPLDQNGYRTERVTCDGYERVQVAFPAEDGVGDVCKHCAVALEVDDEYRLVRADDDGKAPHVCEANGDQGHEVDDGPGSWCNSASIVADEAENSVSVKISVGDPRGGFFMTVRRVDWSKDGSPHCKHCAVPIGYEQVFETDAWQWMSALDGSGMCDTATTEQSPGVVYHEPAGQVLLLHVPHPSDSTPHMPLTKLRDGTYLIGSGAR